MFVQPPLNAAFSRHAHLEVIAIAPRNK